MLSNGLAMSTMSTICFGTMFEKLCDAVAVGFDVKDEVFWLSSLTLSDCLVSFFEATFHMLFHSAFAYYIFCRFCPTLGIDKLYLYDSHDRNQNIFYMVNTCFLTV